MKLKIGQKEREVILMADYICWLCGGKATVSRKYTEDFAGRTLFNSPNKHMRCYCQECFDKVIKAEEEEDKQYMIIRKKRMFEKAIRNLEKQKMDFMKFKEAIDTVEQYNLENLQKFDSSYEIMAAIILIHNHVKIKPQVTIGKYHVDFLLPDEHIVLEIDGDRHEMEKAKAKDTWRDYEIKKILGDDWEIIRISTECLDMNADKLVKAMDKVLDYRLEKKIAWQ